MSKIIVALDNLSMAKALELAEQASGLVWGFKVNDLLLHYGAEIIYKLRAFGGVMADPKLYDIPNTVHNGIQVLKTAGADIITVHASAHYTPKEDEIDLVAGITVLTSFNTASCADVYNAESVRTQVQSFAELLQQKQYKHLVCSPRDIDIAKNWGFTTICPGIRPSWSDPNDQVRITTPAQAIAGGADYLVIGRPLTGAPNFIEAIEKTKAEIGES